MCNFFEFCHLKFTTNGRSFFIHLLGESNILLKYSNYMAFSHVHDVAMNNLGLVIRNIKVYIRREAKFKYSIDKKITILYYTNVLKK